MGKNRRKTNRTSDKKRKWKWIGHAIKKDPNAVERIVLDWNPQGTGKRGRPKKTWKRYREKEGRGER
jgi:hypothetical protein